MIPNASFQSVKDDKTLDTGWDITFQSNSKQLESFAIDVQTENS